ncbi:N6-adenosine-methyltransferase, variant 2 [Balamuthia mandrillaris]
MQSDAQSEETSQEQPPQPQPQPQQDEGQAQPQEEAARPDLLLKKDKELALNLYRAMQKEERPRRERRSKVTTYNERALVDQVFSKINAKATKKEEVGGAEAEKSAGGKVEEASGSGRGRARTGGRRRTSGGGAKGGTPCEQLAPVEWEAENVFDVIHMTAYPMRVRLERDEHTNEEVVWRPYHDDDDDTDNNNDPDKETTITKKRADAQMEVIPKDDEEEQEVERTADASSTSSSSSFSSLSASSSPTKRKLEEIIGGEDGGAGSSSSPSSASASSPSSPFPPSSIKTSSLSPSPPSTTHSFSRSPKVLVLDAEEEEGEDTDRTPRACDIVTSSSLPLQRAISSSPSPPSPSASASTMMEMTNVAKRPERSSAPSSLSRPHSPTTTTAAESGTFDPEEAYERAAKSRTTAAAGVPPDTFHHYPMSWSLDPTNRDVSPNDNALHDAGSSSSIGGGGGEEEEGGSTASSRGSTCQPPLREQEQPHHAACQPPPFTGERSRGDGEEIARAKEETLTSTAATATRKRQPQGEEDAKGKEEALIREIGGEAKAKKEKREKQEGPNMIDDKGKKEQRNSGAHAHASSSPIMRNALDSPYFVPSVSSTSSLPLPPVPFPGRPKPKSSSEKMAYYPMSNASVPQDNNAYRQPYFEPSSHSNTQKPKRVHQDNTIASADYSNAPQQAPYYSPPPPPHRQHYDHNFPPADPHHQHHHPPQLPSHSLPHHRYPPSPYPHPHQQPPSHPHTHPHQPQHQRHRLPSSASPSVPSACATTAAISDTSALVSTSRHMTAVAAEAASYSSRLPSVALSPDVSSALLREATEKRKRKGERERASRSLEDQHLLAKGSMDKYFQQQPHYVHDGHTPSHQYPPHQKHSLSPHAPQQQPPLPQPQYPPSKSPSAVLHSSPRSSVELPYGYSSSSPSSPAASPAPPSLASYPLLPPTPAQQKQLQQQYELFYSSSPSSSSSASSSRTTKPSVEEQATKHYLSASTAAYSRNTPSVPSPSSLHYPSPLHHQQPTKAHNPLNVQLSAPSRISTIAKLDQAVKDVDEFWESLNPPHASTSASSLRSSSRSASSPSKAKISSSHQPSFQSFPQQLQQKLQQHQRQREQQREKLEASVPFNPSLPHKKRLLSCSSPLSKVISLLEKEEQREEEEMRNKIALDLEKSASQAKEEQKRQEEKAETNVCTFENMAKSVMKEKKEETKKEEVQKANADEEDLKTNNNLEPSFAAEGEAPTEDKNDNKRKRQEEQTTNNEAKGPAQKKEKKAPEASKLEEDHKTESDEGTQRSGGMGIETNGITFLDTKSKSEDMEAGSNESTDESTQLHEIEVTDEGENSTSNKHADDASHEGPTLKQLVGRKKCKTTATIPQNGDNELLADKLQSIARYHKSKCPIKNTEKCALCSMLDCPYNDPDHYRNEGCPSCWNNLLQNKNEQLENEEEHYEELETDGEKDKQRMVLEEKQENHDLAASLNYPQDLPNRSLRNPLTKAIIDKAMEKEGKSTSEGFWPEDRKFVDSHFINCDVRYYNMAALGKFDVVLIDPPWRIRGNQLLSNEKTMFNNSKFALSYGTLSNDEIIDIDIGVLSDRGFLFLWVINSQMQFGFECMQRWGYTYVDRITWVKKTPNNNIAISQGYYLLHSSEICLIGVKCKENGGKNLDFIPKVSNDVIFAEIREKSRKPDQLYHVIERMAPGCRKIEIFARNHNLRPGWLSLGNQLGEYYDWGHDLIACDMCGGVIKTGKTRYKSRTKPNCDLCKLCYDKAGGTLEEYFEIENILNEMAFHQYFACDGCHTKPLWGLRFHCDECDDCDLCEVCYDNKVHPSHLPDHSSKHSFSVVELPDLAGGLPVHRMHRCMGCQTKPIIGYRFECLCCNSLSLCMNLALSLSPANVLTL